MTCKDCVYYEVCLTAFSSKGMYLGDDAEEMECFKNKADFVEVVRCEKCKHKGWVQEPCHGKTVDFCRKHSMCIYNTDFCSYGERSDTNG